MKFKTIQLERTMCFGECPVYKVEILSDGTVNYNGEMFVEKKENIPGKQMQPP